MTLFGFQLDVLLFVQIVVTAVLLLVLTLVHSVQKTRAARLDFLHMIPLVSFLIRNHPGIHGVPDLVNLPKDEAGKVKELHDFEDYLNAFEKDGKLPAPGEIAPDSFWTFVLVVALAPLAGIAAVVEVARRTWGCRSFRTDHTSFRKNVFSKVALLLVANLFWVFVVVSLLLPYSLWLAVGLSIIPGVGALGSLVSLCVLVYQQHLWKDFYQEKLLEVTGKAHYGNDVETLNGALLLKQDVESQPDLPIPGSIPFYAVVYSIVQVTVVWAFRSFGT